MLQDEIDENYYDIEGKKICDKTGNIYVNDGNKIYDIETSTEVYEINEEDDKSVKINENKCITLAITCIYLCILSLTKIYNCFYNSIKNINKKT